jgi:hypothetical protein
MDVVDEVLDIVEHAIRQRFKLAAAEFDLAFTDTERKIAWALDTETERIRPRLPMSRRCKLVCRTIRFRRQKTSFGYTRTRKVTGRLSCVLSASLSKGRKRTRCT